MTAKRMEDEKLEKWLECVRSGALANIAPAQVEAELRRARESEVLLAGALVAIGCLDENGEDVGECAADGREEFCIVCTALHAARGDE